MAGSIVSSVVKQPQKGLGLLRIKAQVTCDASGNATATVIGSAFGRIVRVLYDADTFDTGVVLTLSDSDSGAALVTLSSAGTSDLSFRPSSVVADNTGTAITASTSAPNVNRDIFVAGKLKLGASAGGNGGAGSLTVVVQQD